MSKTKRKTKTETKAATPPVRLKPLPAKTLAQFKKELTQMQRRLAADLEELKKTQMPSSLEVTPGDDADVATQTYEKEMLFEISGTERETLMQIEEALRRIEVKNFGYCDRCKKSIPLKRLHVLPYSRYCLNCQSYFESRAS